MIFIPLHALVRAALAELANAYRTIRREGPGLLLAILICFSCFLPGLVVVLVWCFWAATIQNQAQTGHLILEFGSMIAVLIAAGLSGYGTWSLWQKNERVRKLLHKEGATDAH